MEFRGDQNFGAKNSSHSCRQSVLEAVRKPLRFIAKLLMHSCTSSGRSAFAFAIPIPEQHLQGWTTSRCLDF